VDKTILASMEQMRSFDFVQWEHDVQVGLSWLAQDVLSGMLQGTAVGGLVATQASPLSLSFTLSPGRIYQISSNDGVAVGAITQDLTQQCQQGLNAGQTITMTPPSSGQSQWNLVQGQFQQLERRCTWWIWLVDKQPYKHHRSSSAVRQLVQEFRATIQLLHSFGDFFSVIMAE